MQPVVRCGRLWRRHHARRSLEGLVFRGALEQDREEHRDCIRVGSDQASPQRQVSPSGTNLPSLFDHS